MACQSSSKRLLIVDDSREEREMYAEWFRSQGWTTLQADTATDGLRLAQELNPDAAIVDVWLRGAASGLDLTEWLKHDMATAMLPVVILSGLAFPADRRQALRAGCDLFLTKPCLPAVLSRAVTELLERPASAGMLRY